MPGTIGMSILAAQPTCHHAPDVYGGLRETEAAKMLRGFSGRGREE